MSGILRWVGAVSTAACVLLLPPRAGGPGRASAAVAAMAAAPGFPAPDLTFTMRDGTVLPARLWRPPAGAAPAGIVLALHGFTDSRDAWEYPAPAFTAAGYTVIAPDQRGFGATAQRGGWAGQAVMIDDAAELVAQLRARYPGQRLVLMGESMGGAVAICLAARAPATADAYVLDSPAVWGRGQMAPGVRAALWTAAALAPGWRLSGNEVKLDIAATDNRAALLRLAHDPLTTRGATVATLRGLVDLMDSAQAGMAHLPADTLLLAGRRDQVIPPAAMAAAWAKAPPRCGGRSTWAATICCSATGRALPQGDVLAWLARPDAWLPSGADINAASWRADQAWAADVSSAAPAGTLDATAGRSSWPY